MAINVSRLAATTSATTAVVQDPLRKGLVFQNDDANRVYILAGPGTVSSTNYSISLAQNENASIPANIAHHRFTAIWSTAGSGGLNSTEEQG
jgi:hypothetical protein